jgi:hypothetical protein
LPPPSENAAEIDFDLDKDNYVKWSQPTEAPVDPEESLRLSLIGPMDVSVFLWTSRVAMLAAFDALAPYHETAVGVYSRIPRRPSSESATNRNLNIAMMHTQLGVWKRMLPQFVGGLRQMMTALGLNRTTSRRT